jgi:hypothetical protein
MLIDNDHTLLMGRLSRSLEAEDGRVESASGPFGSGPSPPGGLSIVDDLLVAPLARSHDADDTQDAVHVAGDVENRDGPPEPLPAVDFIARFKKPLEQPVLPSTPRMRQTKPIQNLEDDDWIPKRSARLAAKSKFRADKPKAQARKVMMKKLGLEIETATPDEASFDEFHTVFRQPLSPSTREAMNVLFPGRKQRALGAVRAA